jgi:hypothetical protein
MITWGGILSEAAPAKFLNENSARKIPGIEIAILAWDELCPHRAFNMKPVVGAIGFPTPTPWRPLLEPYNISKWSQRKGRWQ